MYAPQTDEGEYNSGAPPAYDEPNPYEEHQHPPNKQHHHQHHQPQQQYAQHYEQPYEQQQYAQQQQYDQYGQPQYAQPHHQHQHGQQQYYEQQPQQQYYAQQQQQYAPQHAHHVYDDSQLETVDPNEVHTVVGQPVAGGEILNYTTDVTPSGTPKWNDVWFIVAFVIHLIIMIILAGVYGSKAISQANDTPPSGTNIRDVDEPNTGVYISVLVVAAVVGAVSSVAWLSIMKRFSHQIIHVSLIGTIAFSILGLIIAFASANVLMGVLFIFSAILSAVYYYFVRARIPFATSVLEASVASIESNPGPIWLVYGLSILQIGWFAFWAFIFASIVSVATEVVNIDNGDGTYSQYRVNQSSSLQFLEAFCILSLYWTSQTIKNIGHVTTSGVVASWWFQPGVSSATRSSLKRATTTSLGSIMFGSLLVALVETTRWLLQQAKRDACRDIVTCLLDCIDRALKYFNRYCYSTVAVYGLSFMESAKRTGQLFQSHLFTAIINDDLSNMVLVCGSFVSGIIAGVIGMLWAYAKDVPEYVALGLVAFLVGAMIATLAMSVIQSAVTTTFICWASDPATLLTNRPNEFGKILDAASGKYKAQDLQPYNGQQLQQQHVQQQPY